MNATTKIRPATRAESAGVGVAESKFIGLQTKLVSGDQEGPRDEVEDKTGWEQTREDVRFP